MQDLGEAEILCRLLSEQRFADMLVLLSGLCSLGDNGVCGPSFGGHGNIGAL